MRGVSKELDTGGKRGKEIRVGGGKYMDEVAALDGIRGTEARRAADMVSEDVIEGRRDVVIIEEE